MKNNILIMLLMATLFIGCQKDEDYDAPNSFSDVGWYFSDTEAPLAVSIDDYITFSDLSQGALSHEWTIGSGNYYLEMPIERNDSIFDDKTIGDGTTNDKTVSVWFKKSGLQSVRLFNTFKEKVTFRGVNDLDERVFIDAEEVDGKWVIDTTFIVDVYDTIVPVIRIEQKGVLIDHTNANDTIFVEAGDFIELYDDTTIGRPDYWEWTIGSAKSYKQNDSLVLKKLGVFKGTFAISRRGQNVPGDYEFYRIPINFKVIPSSQPFVVIPEDIMELKDQTIQVPFNGEFAPFTNQDEHFTVMLNGVETTNFTLTINPDDATILDIKFNEPIFSNDNITVSYDGEGTLESTDTRSPVAFDAKTVSMFQHEIVIFDFEDTSKHINWTAHPENLATTTIAVSTEQSASGGSYSMKVNAAASGNWSSFRNIINQYALTAGVKYKYEYKIYKVAGAAINMNGPWITKNGGETVTQFWNNTVKDAPADTWVTVSPGGRYTSDETAEYFEIYIRHNGMGILYFDDIRILEADER